LTEGIPDYSSQSVLQLSVPPVQLQSWIYNTKCCQAWQL